MAKPLAVIVGVETLLGNDLRDLIAERAPDFRVKGHAAGDETILAAEDDEPAVIAPLEASAVAGAAVVFLAGSAQASRRAYELTARAGSPLIDLTHGLEGLPEAAIRAPMAEPRDWRPPPGRVHVVAHPAAIALAMLLARLAGRRPIRRAVATVLEPASERGRRGIDEIQKQTVRLLSFQSLPQAVFDAQIGFNLLARYGSEAPEPIETFELRMDQHLATLAARHARVPMPSVRLVQAPVFHGHSISLWVELEARAEPEALAADLSSDLIDVRGRDVEPPTNVGVASQSGIAVGAIEADRNHPSAAWLWIAADNHRLAAENALQVARSLAVAK
jgi:aspartate-semialdehyde dehydrogenase